MCFDVVTQRKSYAMYELTIPYGPIWIPDRAAKTEGYNVIWWHTILRDVITMER